MDIDAEMRRKIAVSIVSVGAFFALFIGIGATFGPDLGETGGLVLVGAIVLFIVVMAVVGVVLDG
jgi:multisubunit Na+/H+ antiporter MnhB subunit